MSSSRSKRPPPRKCIFCGGGDLSGEHIWPVWSRPLLTDGPAPGAVETIGNGPHGFAPMRWRRRNRQGRTIDKRVYVVCERCNNGWMSRLETEAKPTLIALATGKRMILDPVRQLAVVKWFTMKMMVAEHDQKNIAVFTPAQNTAFYENRTIPDRLEIWIFECGHEAWRSSYVRNCTEARLTKRTELAKAIAAPAGAMNVQAVSFGFDKLFVYAQHTVPVSLKIDNPVGDRLGFRIWPAPAHGWLWPPPASISGQLAFDLATSLTRVPRIIPANP